MTTLYFPQPISCLCSRVYLIREAVTEDISICDKLSFGESQQFNAFIDRDLFEIRFFETDVKKQSLVLITENCHTYLVLKVIVYLSRNPKF